MIFGINTTRDISKLSQISLAYWLVKLRITISKYHSWYLCQISLQIMLLPILTHRLQTNKVSTVKLKKYMVRLQLLETITTTTTTTKTSANQSWQLHFFEKLTSKFLTIIVLLFPPKAFLSNLVRTESRKGTAGERIQMSSEISHASLPTRF